MKCVQDIDTGEIIRVRDEVAAKATKGEFSRCRYVPKSAWKAQKAAEAAKKAEG